MFELLVSCILLLGFADSQEYAVGTETLSINDNLVSELVLRGNLTTVVDSAFPDIDINLILDEICKQLQNISFSANLTCISQLEVLCHRSDLAATMFDASAKFPYPGMNYNDRRSIGNYDECMTIDDTEHGIRVLGKYCVASLVIPDYKNITNVDLVHKLDICIPDGCSSDDFYSIGMATQPYNLPILVLDNFCSTKESGQEFTAPNILVTSLFLAIVFMMLISTVYDVYLYKTEQKTHHPLYLAFSIFTNGRKLFNSTQYSKDHINIFDGMKVLSMMWVIAGHGFGTYISGVFSVMNQGDMISLHAKRYSGYIDAAHVAVDTFVFMSGFLLSYHYFKNNSRSIAVQFKQIPSMYMHRFFRIIPPVLMMYLSTMFMLPKFGSGPFWQPGIEIHLKPCRKYWWSYVLFIQNYVNWDNLCLVPHWYLSVDIQCFILSPLFLIPTSWLLKKSNGLKLSMIFLMILNLVGVAFPMAIWVLFPEYKNEYGTHSRLTDFFIGMTMGVYMRSKYSKSFLWFFDRKKLPKINFGIWLIVLIGMFTILFFYQDAEMNQTFTQRLFYFGLYRPAWSISLCWIVYSCYHGYGGFVNWILARPIFLFGSKLTYCMYLVHYIVIGHYSLSNRVKWYFSDYVEFYLWCGYFLETIIWALFWTLAFESPVIVFEKYLMQQTPKVEQKMTSQA